MIFSKSGYNDFILVKLTSFNSRYNKEKSWNEKGIYAKIFKDIYKITYILSYTLLIFKVYSIKISLVNDISYPFGFLKNILYLFFIFLSIIKLIILNLIIKKLIIQ